MITMKCIWGVWEGTRQYLQYTYFKTASVIARVC